jgi:hypothetical protein
MVTVTVSSNDNHGGASRTPASLRGASEPLLDHSVRQEHR